MPRQRAKKEEREWWFEEYKQCGCSYVAEFKRELVGYCGRHGTDRQSIPSRIPANSCKLGLSS